MLPFLGFELFRIMTFEVRCICKNEFSPIINYLSWALSSYLRLCAYSFHKCILLTGFLKEFIYRLPKPWHGLSFICHLYIYFHSLFFYIKVEGFHPLEINIPDLLLFRELQFSEWWKPLSLQKYFVRVWKWVVFKVFTSTYKWSCLIMPLTFDFRFIWASTSSGTLNLQISGALSRRYACCLFTFLKVHLKVQSLEC